MKKIPCCHCSSVCYLGIPRHFVPYKVERGGCRSRSRSRRLDDDFFVVEIDSFVLLPFFHCLPFTARYDIPLILGCIIDPIACSPRQSEAVLFVYRPFFYHQIHHTTTFTNRRHGTLNSHEPTNLPTRRTPRQWMPSRRRG